jgi:hypothetical protein
VITERPAHHYGPTLDELVDEASCKSQSGWDWTGPPSQVAPARNLTITRRRRMGASRGRAAADDQLRHAGPRVRPRLHRERSPRGRHPDRRFQLVRLRRAQRLPRAAPLRGIDTAGQETEALEPFKGDGGLVDVGGDLRSGSARLLKPGSRSAVSAPAKRTPVGWVNSVGRSGSVCLQEDPSDRVLDSREASPHRRRPVSSDRARLTCTRRAVSGRGPCPHEKQRPHGLEPRQRRIGLSVPAVDGAPAAT